MRAHTKYAKAGDVHIAYQVVGDGPIDLVVVPGWVTHLEVQYWEEPSIARFFERLASFARLILFDKRGTGLSDRVARNDLPTLEQRMEDLHAVMDAAGSRRAALFGISEGGPMSALFAATYPDRTSALVMSGCYAKWIRADDYPWAPTRADHEAAFDAYERNWGTPIGFKTVAPSAANDEGARNWWARNLRLGASPADGIALYRMNIEIDIRPVLPTIAVPTLILHRAGDRLINVGNGRYLAEQIPPPDTWSSTARTICLGLAMPTPCSARCRNSSPAFALPTSTRGCSPPCCSPTSPARPSRWRPSGTRRGATGWTPSTAARGSSSSASAVA